jgi:hypothetical protein
MYAITAHAKCTHMVDMPVIVRQLQHDVPVPPLDAVSVRTWTSDPWPQADQSNRRWTEADSPAMPIVSVTLGDRCVSGRTRADPPIWSVIRSKSGRSATAPEWVIGAWPAAIGRRAGARGRLEAYLRAMRT